MSDSFAIEWVQTYRPYGLDYWGGEPTNGTYKFTGQRQDYEFGEEGQPPFGAVYDYKARSYLPGEGVFAQPDPIDVTAARLLDPQQLNPYAYARGNPLKYVDPNGKAIWLPFIVGLGFVLDHIVDPPSAYAPIPGQSDEEAEAEFDATNPIPEIYAAVNLARVGVSLVRGAASLAGGLFRAFGRSGDEIAEVSGRAIATRMGNITKEIDSLKVGANEASAAQAFASAGYDVKHLQSAASQGIEGVRTADLFVRGIGRVDVFTPRSLSLTAISRGIASKATQASTVLVQANISVSGMILTSRRVFGKSEAAAIKEIIFQTANGTLIRFRRPPAK